MMITVVTFYYPRGPHCCGGYEPGHGERPDQPYGHHLHQEEGGDNGSDLQYGERKWGGTTKVNVDILNSFYF